MEIILQLFIFLPFAGFIVSLFFNNTQEQLISRLSFICVGLQLIGITLFNIYWLWQQSPVINLKHFVFFKEDTIEIFLSFYFDKTTAVFSFLGALVTF
ncbi:MAG TPA: hypothetical protein PK736_08635, partial [Bacteroidia bacterium]|nr:hypothetical protein [Bacteroidia bacterium]